jgi:hypothetical protein
MERFSQSRKDRTDLLVRPPCTAHEIECGWTASFIDPIEQLEALADLWSRGLLSREEFERQKEKIFYAS